MLHICTDQGASSTRFSFNNSKVYENPNNFTVINDSDDIRLIPNSSDFKDNIDLGIIKSSSSDFFPVRILGGSLANRYSSACLKPTMLSNKSKQAVNYYSIIAAIASSMLASSEDKADVACYICLPPVEISGNNENEDYVKNQLIGDYKITLHKLDKQIEFSIKSVYIFPESVMAISSFLFNTDGTQRVDMAKYNTGYILSFDLGASTADLALIKDRKFVDYTGHTYKLGGNIIDEFMRNEIRRKFGSEVTDDVISEVIRTGRLPYGSTYKDMSLELQKCKKEFARILFDKMQTYFSAVGVSLQSIKAIFISGGGSMKSSYIDDVGNIIDTSPSVSEYIAELIYSVCDSVDMVSAPFDNPRECNIIGTILNMNVLRRINKN